MSIAEPPAHMPGDDLEGLLRTFFRNQMPKSWPPPPVPVSSALSPRRRGHNLIRSRWTLAASIALLLLGSLLLPNRITQTAKPENSYNGTPIGSDDLRRHMEREHHQRQKQNKPGFAVEENELPPERGDSDLPIH